MIPDRKPDFVSDEDVYIWFDEMVCRTRITQKGEHYDCYLTLGLENRNVGFYLPKEAKVNSFQALLGGITPGSIIFFTDDVSEAYWKHVAEKILLDETTR